MIIFKKIASFFQKQPKHILTEDGLVYILKENDQTAILVKDKTAEGDVIIPHSISFESKEFIVKEVLENAFNGSVDINSIRFSEDSEVTKIGEGAFFFSSIESISLPRKLTKIPKFLFSSCINLQNIEIQENSELRAIDSYAFSKSPITSLFIPPNAELQSLWCDRTPNLNSITISPKNHRYSQYEGQFILGKTDENGDIFDSIVFARRDIEIAKIPSFVKKISICSFDYCQKLKKIEFSETSSELVFGENSFAYSSLKSISIPSYATQISDSTFFSCTKLNKVNFEGESKLSEINSFAFSSTKIESFVFPSSVKKIGNSSFENCMNLRKIRFCENSKLELIGDYAFSRTKIGSIEIPQNVEKIGTEVFYSCDNLQIIEISEQSKLIYFEVKSIGTSHPLIMIPQNLNIMFC